MDQSLFSAFGYAAVLAGCVIEGETVLIAAGLAAQGGYLSLPLVILFAWVGATSGDHSFFLLGHYKGDSILRLRPSWRGRIDKALRLIERYGGFLIFGSRFMCGFRAVGPFAIGTAKVGVGRFTSLNLASSLVWALFFGLTGYCSGSAVGSFITGLGLPLIVLFLALCCGALAVMRRPSVAKQAFRVLKAMSPRWGLAGRLLRNIGLSHGHRA